MKRSMPAVKNIADTDHQTPVDAVAGGGSGRIESQGILADGW